MREIKFRAWQGGRFNYWGFIKSKYGDDYEFHAIADNNAEPLSMTEKMNRSQQYTGLKDKNGKEIYEGDILSAQIKNPPLRYEVRMVNGAWAETKSNGYIHYFKDMADAWSCLPFEEVIGNIWEDKELL